MSLKHPGPRTLAWTVFALVVGAAGVSHAEVVSLAELETSALKNRPALAREEARTRAADADLDKAASAYYPQFAIKGGADVGPGRQLLKVNKDGVDYYIPGSPALGHGGGSVLMGYPRSSLELSASANLYDFGRTKAATEASHEGHAAALANRAATESELRKAVRESYLNWLLQSELARLTSEAVQEAKQRRERVTALIGEGAKPKGELTPARAEELLAELESKRAQRDLLAARLGVEQATGIPLSGSAEPDLQLLDAQSSLPDSSEQHAKNLAALAQRFRMAQALADAQAKLNRPQLGIGLSAGVRTSTQAITDLNAPDQGPVKTRVFPLYGAGLTLSIPLWDGGLTRASAEAARARADEAKANLQEFEIAEDLAQRQAQIDLESARERLVASEELISVCSARLQDAEAGYELGVSSIDLIGQARALLRRAKTEALLARVDHAAARLRLIQRDRSAPKR